MNEKGTSEEDELKLMKVVDWFIAAKFKERESEYKKAQILVSMTLFISTANPLFTPLWFFCGNRFGSFVIMAMFFTNMINLLLFRSGRLGLHLMCHLVLAVILSLGVVPMLST